jgi:hypothetical protein
MGTTIIIPIVGHLMLKIIIVIGPSSNILMPMKINGRDTQLDKVNGDSDKQQEGNKTLRRVT